MRKWKVLSVTVAIGLALAGCGGSSNGMKEAAYDTAAAEAGEAPADDVAYEYEAAVTEDGMMDAGAGGSEAPRVADVNRKLIKTVNLQVETEAFDELLVAVGNRTEGLGGYIEESYTYNGSQYYGRGTRNASMTIRIPVEKLEEFLSDISEASNVISRNDSVTDVTLQYVDMESHKKALVAEQDRLLELLELAENVEDIISIESRLSEVRYQIESMESQLRTMDNQVSYSTIYLSIEEVKQYTPVAEQSIGEKIVTGFQRSLVDVGNGFVNFGVGVLINLPYIVVWAVILIVIGLIVRMIIKRRHRKKLNKQLMQAENTMMAEAEQEKKEENKENE